jgi:anti-sigma factor RsiW
MTCEGWRAKLDTYADGELSADEMRAFDAHARGCASCAADALARVGMKRSVKAVAGKRFTATPEFRRQIEHSLSTKPRRSFGFGFSWMTTAAAAIAILAAIALAITYQGRERERANQLLGEIADLHVANLASASPVEVVSTDRHTVKPWFQGKIPFTFNLPELQNSGFTLLGGRMTYLDQAAGAHLIYEVRKHRISVFVFQEKSLQGRLNENFPARKEMSFNMETWNSGGLRYIVVGDANAADISELSKLFRTIS